MQKDAKEFLQKCDVLQKFGQIDVNIKNTRISETLIFFILD